MSHQILAKSAPSLICSEVDKLQHRVHVHIKRAMRFAIMTGNQKYCGPGHTHVIFHK